MFNTDNVLCGTHGELWIDDIEYQEVTAFKAELTPEFGDVNKAKSMAKHKKLIGYELKGEVTLNKVLSFLMMKVAKNLKKGKATRVKIISNIDDPDALGNERIVLYDAILEKATLADWQSKQIQEEKIPFTATEWEILESI
ncbi:phage tail tube protein [Peptostreptococcus canis]|uniref:Phage tail tube protein n=1 Tax=Peptostreptococcus canis TaxID=1159213 RepID=A0ABR6TMY4_9FIRM|nr:phage tail tube protein [Peptostreptococcus canis]MBC2576578.1 phage tail tube protein [Peptostreptococcus canis]MBP1998765.1 hypothetical protein [Peptostreptococcus canis]